MNITIFQRTILGDEFDVWMDNKEEDGTINHVVVGEIRRLPQDKEYYFSLNSKLFRKDSEFEFDVKELRLVCKKMVEMNKELDK